MTLKTYSQILKTQEVFNELEDNLLKVTTKLSVFSLTNMTF